MLWEGFPNDACGRNADQEERWPFNPRRPGPSSALTSDLGGETVPKKIHRRLDADPKEGVRKYGKVRFADQTNRKYPIDSPGHIKAAWAYIHQPENAAKYTPDEVRTIKIRIRRAAKTRGVTLPDPDEFVELMRRVRKKKR